ncbi:MAG: TonB-dependent receptor [Thalassotalea sp.]
MSVVPLLCGQLAYAAEETPTAAEIKAKAEAAVEVKKAGKDKKVIEVIEVTGFRGSATRQLNNKRFSKNISDSIFAEDMGKMPDANIAEAMSRITGIGIDRVDGEGTQITIRGVEGSLNNVQMNGVTMSSTNSNDPTEETGNSVDFSMMSADMLRSIEVIKSPSANHDEGSLGGTVRLNTWKPLDIKNKLTIVSVKGVYNDLSEEFSPTIGISFGENFSDNFGMTASVNYSKNKTRQDRMSNWRWQYRNANPAVSTQTGDDMGANYWTKDNPVDMDGNGVIDNPFEAGVGNTRVFDPQNYEKSLSLIETENLSASSSFQYQINDDASVWLDLAYSQRDKTKLQYNHTLSNVFNDSNLNRVDEETATSTFLDGNQARARIVAFEQPLESDTTTVGLNYQQLLFDGAWTLDAKLGYSGSTAYKPIENSRRLIFNTGGAAANVQPAVVDWLDENGNVLLTPDYSIGGEAGGTFPAENVPVQSMQYLTRDVDNTNLTYQLDLAGDVEFGPIVGIGMGVKIVSQKTLGQGFAFHANVDSTIPVLDADGNPVLDAEGNPETLRLGDTTVADFPAEFPVDDYLTRVVGDSQNGWVLPDFDAMYSAFFPNALEVINAIGDTLQQELDEEDANETTFDSQAIYLMADYELLGGKLKGDFGVRYVKTQAYARGRAGFNMREYVEFEVTDDEGNVVLDEEGNPEIDGNYTGNNFSIGNGVYGDIEYTNLLPSFNSRYMLSEEMLLRFSVAKVMARPRPNRLVPGYLFNTRNANNVTAVAGNPALKPTQALQYDLSWEWYFDETGMVSLAAFYKDFETMTYQKNEERSFTDSDCASAEEFPEGQQEFRDLHCGLILEGVDTRQDVNGDGGEIYGIETSFQKDFTFLPGWAQYFGTVVNYTYADSEATFVDKDQEADTAALLDGFPMRNTSKHTFNGTLYWENEGFSARIAYNFRSKRLNNPNKFDGALWTDDRTTVDFSARYKVSKLLSFNFAATNLTDSYNRVFITRVNEEAANGLFNEGNALDGNTPTWRTQELDHNGRNYRLGMTYKF